MFYFASLYLQEILGYGPLKAGLAFLPFTFGIVIGAGAAQQLIPRIGVRAVVAVGITLGALGLSASRSCRRRHLPRAMCCPGIADVDRHGDDVRAVHADRDDERRRRRRRARVRALQHVAAGRRRARARRALDARGVADEPPVERRARRRPRPAPTRLTSGYHVAFAVGALMLAGRSWCWR